MIRRLVLHCSFVLIATEPNAAGTTNVSTLEGQTGEMVCGSKEATG
jgi:hypothetical protein